MEQTRTRRRGAAPALSRERIVEAALALIADETLAGLSTRRLGQRLGVEAMSIYHHFPSKQHLVDALVDHCIQSMAQPPDRGDPLRRLRETVDEHRAMAQRFPQLYPLVAIHRLNTPVGVRWIEWMLGL